MNRFPAYESSGNQTASGQITTKNVLFGGIVVATDGTNDVTFTAYNGTSAVDANAVTAKNITIKGSDQYGGVFPKFPVRCKDGIYVAVSGTGANYVVYYAERAEGYFYE